MANAGHVRRTRSISALLAFVLIATPLLTAFPAVAYAEEVETVEPTAATTIGSVELPAGAVEDVSLRDAFSAHYRLLDGTVRAVVSGAPVNYRGADGGWLPIDTTLVSDGTPDGHRTGAAGATARFKGPFESGRPVTLERGDLAVTIDMLGVAEGAHVALGDTARYLSVAPSTDLVYEALADGLKQTLILTSPAALASFSFALGVEGGGLVRAPGGWVVSETGKEAPALSLGAILVTDADGARCEDATLSVVPDGLGGATVTYDVSRTWLDDPARVYPVAVDPTLQVDQDTYVHSIDNTDYHGGDGYIKVGSNTTTGYNYGLVRFDCTSFENTKITNADFKVYCNSTSAGSHTYLGRNTSYWSESWRYSDGLPAKSWLGTKTLPAAGWVTWGVDATVQEWADGIGAAWWYGLQLYQPSTDGTFHYKSFYSSEYATTSLRPVLVVDYTLDPVTNVTACTKESYDWFREVDRNADGISDTPNDLARVGRGGVDLSWPQNTRAAGYDIYQCDGDTYEKVGTTLGSTSTTWTSEGAGIYPTDSEIAGWGVASRNAFTRAASPRAATLSQTLSVSGETGAGVVVTDGTYLYVRGWGSTTYPGPTSWKRVGTGYHGTTAGADYGTLGPDFSTKRIQSAFYLDGFIYNGYANTPTTITGVWKGAAAESTETATFTFSAPLLARSTGAALTAASGDVLLTTDGERIYNVAYGIGGSTAKNGYTIRVFDHDGQKLFDRTIATPSDQLDGALTDGDALYLMEWDSTDSANVTKVRLADFHIANRWTINQASTRVINGCYDEENKCFWLGSLDTGTVRRYLGPGLDLRDDPEPLYEKSTGTLYLDASHYAYRIVPFNTNATAVLIDCVAYTPTLDNRTVRVNDQARHTTAGLPEVAGHTATAELDSCALTLDAVDLTLASWGPEAAVSRHYSSESTAASLLHGAPGWRFSFERALEVTSTSVTYVDESGERDRFVLTGGVYAAPNGSYARLTTETAGGALRYRIIETDRSSSVFDPTGKLLADDDQAGNAVTYERSSVELTITAANGQSIVVDFDASGHPESATYATPDGTRTVAYEDRGSGIVAISTYPGEAEERTVVLTHTGGYLTAAGIEGYAPSSTEASWTAVYSSGKLSSLRLPGYSSQSARRVEVTGTATWGTVTRFGQVDGVDDTVVVSRYTWNPTGTTATMTDPYKSGTTPATWTYAYNPANEPVLETAPTGTTVSRTMDSRGNTLAEVDEEGHRTTYVFDALDRCVRETDPRGATTYRTYASTGRENAGPVTVEERQLNEAERSRTEYSYNTSATLTQEKQKLNPTEWATTTYAAFALSGEAGTTTREDVLLETGGTPVDLTEYVTFDAFGNTLSRTDAAGVATEESTYDLAGRALTTEDATGTVTHYAYDTVGRETLTYREATDGTWCDRTATGYDADGNSLTETRYLADASGNPVADATVERTFDPMGRETASDDSQVTGSAVTRYDARGNARKSWAEGAATAEDIAATRTTYDDYGRVTTETAPGATTASTVTTYFPDGQVKKTTNPDGTYTAFTYDESGNTIAETAPAEDGGTVVTTRAHDIGGRMVADTSPEGDTTTGVFDLAGRQTRAAAEGAPATVTTYNTLGWRLSETDADGVTKSWTYDACGRVLVETTAGETTTSTYDESGNTVEQVNPDGSSVISEYDGFGQVEASTQLATDDTVVSDAVTDYDAQGRPVETIDAARDTTVTLDYASDGTVTSVRDLAGVVTTTTTDPLGLRQAQAAKTASGATITRSLTDTDTAMRPVTWQVDGNAPVGVAYDEVGRLRVQDAIVPEDGEASSGGIVPAGLPPAGVNYVFDEDSGRKLHDGFLFTYANRAEDTTYTYTPAGRVASVVKDLATTKYAFDLAGAGNLTGIRRPGETTTTLTYGSGNRLATMSGPAGSFTYGWDAAKGWRTSAKRSGESSVTYTYTAGRLTSYADPNASTAAAFAYDATGQRVRSVTTQGSLTTTSTFIYDGLLLERTASERSDGTTLSVSYFFDEENDPYAAIYESGEATPVVFTVITTDRGDVRELQDADGASFAFYSYDAFGRPTETTTTATASLDATTAAEIAAANPLRYAGYCYDGFSGLYYLSQRYYDPATAQFITKDPAKADGEESAYQYCGGDPVGKVDPSGEWNAYVHETLTKGWAKGFTDSEKKTIARGDLFVDRDPSYHGSWSHPSHWKYHFGTWGAWRVGASFYNQAVTLWRRGSRGNALFRLGMALHTRQDYYGHGPLNPGFHPTKTVNGKMIESIDSWSSAKRDYKHGKWRASSTASASRAMMCAFRKAVGR